MCYRMDAKDREHEAVWDGLTTTVLPPHTSHFPGIIEYRGARGVRVIVNWELKWQINWGE